MGDANSLVWRAKVLGYAQFVIRKERSETFGRSYSYTVPVAMSCHVYDFCRSVKSVAMCIYWFEMAILCKCCVCVSTRVGYAL